MTQTVSLCPERQNPQAEAMAIAQQAMSFQVCTPETYSAAGELLKEVKRFHKAIETFFAPMKDAAYATHREICERCAKALEPLKKAENTLKAALTAYTIAERQKIEEERQRAEIARQKEIAELEAQKQAMAEKLIAEGKTQEAEAVSNIHVAFMVDGPRTAEMTKVKGLSSRTTYRAEVYDFAALIRGAAAWPQYEQYLMPNQKVLDAMARGYKASSDIPGVRFVAEESMSVRA